MINNTIRFFLENKLIAVLLLLVLVGWGIAVAPFSWNVDILPRDPVPVDAIPNLGENQQIVYTRWSGRSPQDVEDQITYPLTTQLLGVPGVKTIRSSSMIGTSSIYIIFEEDVEFYWSRSRILEKLNSLPSGTLPEGVQPQLGPDATALGQVFWYTLEGRDEQGNPAGGWDLQELRSIQDFFVGYALSSVEGVAEVAPIGGFVKEYQVDVDPTAMKINDVTLVDVFKAVKNSNVEVGARTIELNRVEYLVRGLGYVESLEDLEEAVVKVNGNTPIRVKDVAHVTTGPAFRRGALDKGGTEAVGAVVVAREGANPLEVINNVKAKIGEISSGLPAKTLDDGTRSKVSVVPFYDRSELIHETLGTLEEALNLEILITVIVIIVMVVNLRTSALISGMGVVLSENMLTHMREADDDEPLLEVIYRASTEVASAVITAVATTIISFLPVFTMIAAEGKLFRPLAFTKTYVLLASIIITITLIPPFAHWFFSINIRKKWIHTVWNGLLIVGGIFIMFFQFFSGLFLLFIGLFNGGLMAWETVKGNRIEEKWRNFGNVGLIVLWASIWLSEAWLPLGPASGALLNWLFVAFLLLFILGGFYGLMILYPRVLRWCLNHKALFLSIPTFFVVWGLVIWLGFATVFGFIPRLGNAVGLDIGQSGVWKSAQAAFPGLGEEFMPPLDEGAFLLMPTTMPHAGIEETLEQVQMLDRRVEQIPEVETVVGKMGRTESALDPAPISMYENVITYKSEYKTDETGRRIRFAINSSGEFIRDENGELIPDTDGQFYRQWRDHIQSPDDIWEEIVEQARIPGLTSAPKLQPIQTRLIMLQTGMRAPMGLKVKGPDLETLESFGLKLEEHLKEVPGIKPNSVFADRVVGKPYLEIEPDRQMLARYGISMQDFQHFVNVAIGGVPLTTTVEGRERYPVRVRYARELRDDPQAIENMLVPTSTGTEVPLTQLAEVKYRQGPQVIKSEDTFLISYVIFDKQENIAEVDVVEQAQQVLNSKIENGDLEVPPGVSYEFAGNYENQVRAAKRLSVILPIALLTIFLILYFQFRSVSTTLMIFSSIFVAWAGGFMLLWLYGEPWFLNFELFGSNLRELFQMQTTNLSVAVWVGFLALFGIAADGAVVLATYLKQLFERDQPGNTSDIRATVIEAADRRIRPTLMTTATTILALIPVLTSTGRGSDIMVPMAIPSVGGMLLQIVTLFVIPVLYSWWHERKVNPKTR